MERDAAGASLVQRVLVVDDDPAVHGLLLFPLRTAGFEVSAVSTGGAALEGVQDTGPDVILLDVMLPDLSGIEVCRRLRGDSLTRHVAVLMLTARAEEFDRLLGFEAGADDYVVKPFSVREVVMRVRALARRAAELRHARAVPRTETTRAWKGLSIDTARKLVFVDGVQTELRPLEYRLVALLAEHPERTFTRAELLEEVWGMSGDVQTRTVDTHVRRLRERLGPYEDAVETVYGEGYRLRSLRP